MKRFLVPAVVAVTVGASFWLAARSRHGAGNHAATLTYKYEIQSRGGMGGALRIESSWAGKITLRPDSTSSSWLAFASATVASLQVNGSSRSELIRQMIPHYERVFRVKLDANGFVSGLEWVDSGETLEPGSRSPLPSRPDLPLRDHQQPERNR